MVWLLRCPDPDPRGKPLYAVSVANNRVAVSETQACARRFDDAQDALAYLNAHPELTGWPLVRAIT